MVYDFNGLNIAIPDATLQNYMEKLELTKEEAIQLYLEDNDYQQNPEQAALNEKAKALKVSTLLGAASGRPRPMNEKRVRKTDVVKHDLVGKLVTFLNDNGAVDVNIKTVDKLITFKIGDDEYKLDLIKTRKQKTS